jgi:bifunctional non-homologous end joining protein LigD
MSARLERYREMRDFRRTPEPSGKGRRPAREEGLHYYIQRHAARRLHYDFRLELNGVLLSWAVPKGPSLDPAERRMAVQTEDHPLDYGEFEGVIPEKQYGAGDVLLWDQGIWTPLDPDPAAAHRKGRLHFRLEGSKLHGDWVLTRIRKEDDKPVWLLIKRNDDEARTGEQAEITLVAPQSVKRAPERATRARKADLPQFIAPQLATLVTEPPRTGRWVYEVKHDGYRMLARSSARQVSLFTRSGKDWTARLPHLHSALKKLALKDAWLDGEIVVQKAGGRSSFQGLQNAFDRGNDANIVYFVFDAPFLSGQDLRRLPLEERKKRLAAALKKAKDPAVRLSEHLEGDAKEVLDQACKLELEGLIGKELDAVYVSGRSKSWIKLKCRPRQDFVIAGYTAPGGSRHGFGAILVGTYDQAGKLHYAGKVGTGFDDELLSTLSRRFAAIKRPDSPLENPPREKNVQWLRPVLVAEVAYAERTEEGILRQAAFMGLREDMAAKSVGEETPQAPPQISRSRSSNAKSNAKSNEVRGVAISHPDRLVWPSLGITKLELAQYCDAVGDWLLPHVKDRPLTMVRCPDGAEAKCFYQRHLLMGASPGDVKTFKRERSGKGAYIYVSSMEAVISAVQNGAVEFHTWGATVPDVKHPDRFTIDLDPGPDLPWAKLLEATRLTRTLLDGIGLKSFLKTTGGKGLHVVVPIKPDLGWEEIKEFTHRIALMLTKARPDLFLASMAKERRGGKVFVDYLRNSETASAVAAFSPRARPGAMVSTPLAWEELGATDLRTKFTVKSVAQRLARLKADPWRDYWKTRQAITVKMRQALGA